jgi:methyl-accepting chemotaxis protein
MIKLSSLTIVGRLAGGFGLLMALLIANAGIGAFGIQALFTNAHRAITNDVQLSQTASVIGQLILNERRFEKDVFINIGDAEVRASYKKKWDAARSSLDENIAVARKLGLAENDKKALGQVGETQAVVQSAAPATAQTPPARRPTAVGSDGGWKEF